MTKANLTLQDARRLAIDCQGLNGRFSGSLLELFRQLGCVQLDPISHVAPTHELVLHSRLGEYDRDMLEQLRWVEKSLFEYWAHAASIVLTEQFPVYQWQMARVRARGRLEQWLAENPHLHAQRDRIVAQLRQEKAVFSRDIDEAVKDPIVSRWYSSRHTPRLLSMMWDRGETAVVGRQGRQRQWGMLDEFLPDWTPQDVWSDEQVTRFAVRQALKSLGVATVPQIKRHFTRNRYPKITAVLNKLLKSGELLSVDLRDGNTTINGDWVIRAVDWERLVQIRQGAWQPQTVLLSPFDNLICDRDRTELLWGFNFRIEIYVPPAKRQYGYYVLPVLHGDQLIGRIDSKMNRRTNTYEVNQIYTEPGVQWEGAVITAVEAAINRLAKFLGATAVQRLENGSP